MSESFDRAEAELGEWLPQLAGAIAILVLGLLLAWALGRLTVRLLAAAGIDKIAARHGVHEALGRPDRAPALSLVAGQLVRIVLSLVVLVAAISTLGIAGIQPALNELLLYVPRIVAALVLIAAGFFVGRLVVGPVDRLTTQLAIDAPLGRIAFVLVVGLFGATALAQLGIPTIILVVFGSILLVTAGLTTALAFGLGGRDVARELSAGRYVTSSFELGQRVSLDAVDGEIVAFDSIVVVVRRADGGMIRIPNHVLLHSIVATDRDARVRGTTAGE